MKRIWDSFNFSDVMEKSAFDYLTELSEPLFEKTSGLLKMEVEAVDSYFEDEPPKLVALYMLYVVATKLGNYRKKIRNVVEYSDNGRFPADIMNHLGNEKLTNMEAINFESTLETNLSKPIVKNSIESLFKQSKEAGK